MAGKNGGARPGAGRPRKADKHAGAIVAAEKQIADQLPAIVEKLLYLAKGGYKREEEKFEYQIDPASPNGERIKVPIELKVSYAEPDRQALIYLTDRILGKTPQAVELSGQDGGPIPVALTDLSGEDLNALERIARQLAGVGPDGGAG